MIIACWRLRSGVDEVLAVFDKDGFAGVALDNEVVFETAACFGAAILRPRASASAGFFDEAMIAITGRGFQ